MRVTKLVLWPLLAVELHYVSAKNVVNFLFRGPEAANESKVEDEEALEVVNIDRPIDRFPNATFYSEGLHQLRGSLSQDQNDGRVFEERDLQSCIGSWSRLRDVLERQNNYNRVVSICRGRRIEASGRAIIINGDGVTVQCERGSRNCEFVNRNLQTRFFAVRGRRVTFRNLVFNGNGRLVQGNGGCIAFQTNNGGLNTVTGSVFRNCVSRGDGGAIASMGQLELRDTQFQNNRARNGRGGPAYVRGPENRFGPQNSRARNNDARSCPNGVYYSASRRCQPLNGGNFRNNNFRNNFRNGSSRNVCGEVALRRALEDGVQRITLCRDPNFDENSGIKVTRTLRVRRANTIIYCQGGGNGGRCSLVARFNDGPIMEVLSAANNVEINGIRFKGAQNLDGDGGGLRILGRNADLIGNLFEDNEARNCGGVWADGFNQITLINNEFRDNFAQESAGAMCGAVVTCTSSGNRNGNRRCSRNNRGSGNKSRDCSEWLNTSSGGQSCNEVRRMGDRNR